MNNPFMRGLKPVGIIAADKPHGVRLRYMAGCRCFKCRRANSDYERMRGLARKAGDWNGIVSAEKARAHLLKLSRAGVGRRAVCAASDVADSVVQEIRRGKRARIRARTERRLLAVTTACRADQSHVPARRLWRRIELLVEEGFTKTDIARRLGYAHALQFRKDFVTAKNDQAVGVLFRRLMS